MKNSEKNIKVAFCGKRVIGTADRMNFSGKSVFSNVWHRTEVSQKGEFEEFSPEKMQKCISKIKIMDFLRKSKEETNKKGKHCYYKEVHKGNVRVKRMKYPIVEKMYNGIQGKNKGPWPAENCD